jgi:hypothetical protein
MIEDRMQETPHLCGEVALAVLALRLDREARGDGRLGMRGVHRVCRIAGRDDAHAPHDTAS